MTTGIDTVTLWRPAGPEELALVEASGWRKWPPRLAGQPIFYPVLNEEYATMIARDWNVRQSGAGYVDWLPGMTGRDLLGQCGRRRLATSSDSPERAS